MNRVRELRLDRKLTLEALAEKAGLSKSALQRIEKGETALNVQSMRILARALGVSPGELLNEADLSPWRTPAEKRAYAALRRIPAEKIDAALSILEALAKDDDSPKEP